MNKNEQIKIAFEDHLLKVLVDGEQVLVVDSEAGERKEVRVAPSASILAVVRAYLKDYPPTPENPLAAPGHGAVLKRFSERLPFPSGTHAN